MWPGASNKVKRRCSNVNISFEHYTVLPFNLSFGSTSAINANYQAYICFSLAYCLFLVSSCSSTNFNYFMIFPVKVDFPESTCPMKIKLADYKWNESIFEYLFGYHYLALSSFAVIVGSSFLIITYYFYYFGFYLGFCSTGFFLFAYFFFFFLSRLKSKPLNFFIRYSFWWL